MHIEPLKLNFDLPEKEKGEILKDVNSQQNQVLASNGNSSFQGLRYSSTYNMVVSNSTYKTYTAYVVETSSNSH